MRGALLFALFHDGNMRLWSGLCDACDGLKMRDCGSFWDVTIPVSAFGPLPEMNSMHGLPRNEKKACQQLRKRLRCEEMNVSEMARELGKLGRGRKKTMTPAAV